MWEPVLQFIARRVNRVRVNRVIHSHDAAGPVVLKSRRYGGAALSWLGNLFLVLSGSCSRMVVREQEWLNWESHCLELLYRDQDVVVRRGKTLVMRKFEGVTIRQLVENEILLGEAVALMATELSRVHQLECTFYRSAWSHGDLHLDNVLIDIPNKTARLIDFDIRHDRRVPAIQRQTDDVKSVLLELISLSSEGWRRTTTDFLSGYMRNCPAILPAIRSELEVPRGFSRILWYTKTSGLPVAEVEPRLRYVRTSLDELAQEKQQGG